MPASDRHSPRFAAGSGARWARIGHGLYRARSIASGFQDRDPQSCACADDEPGRFVATYLPWPARELSGCVSGLAGVCDARRSADSGRSCHPPSRCVLTDAFAYECRERNAGLGGRVRHARHAGADGRGDVSPVAADSTLRGALRSMSRPITRIVTSVCSARSLLLASILLATMAATGCTSEGTSSGSPGAVGASGPTTSIPPQTPSPAVTPDPATPPPRDGGGDPPSPGSPPVVLPTDVPVDPIERVLTGTVRRTGGCTVLLVGTRRWPLVGDLATSLTVDSRLTVSGGVFPVSGACSPTESGPAIRVTSVQPA